VKYQATLRPREHAVGIVVAAAAPSRAPTDEPSWTIEELSDVRPTVVTRRPDRWLGLLVAAGVAVVSFGFVGQAWEPVAPHSGSSVVGVESTSLPQEPPGRPPLDGDSVPGGSARGPIANGDLTEGVPVASWSADPTSIVVTGSAPATIDVVTIEVRTHTGRLLASAVVPIAPDDERPGSNCPHRLGLGRFQWRVAVPGPARRGGLRLDVTWRDTPAGTVGVTVHRTRVVPGPAAPEGGRPGGAADRWSRAP
jgi:hypothetical protein